jgi:bilirubin oxidase
MYTVEPGEKFVYEFEVLNRAGTSFYHSHAHHLTAEQVYKGLAGMITVSDDEEKALDLPRGEYDVPLVIQDRTFDDNNQLQYLHGMMGKMMGFLGDTILVNGKKDAEFAVKTHAYRFRALNGSSSRIYKLGWEDGTPLTAIGTDACLLEKPETRPYIMLAPGERVDLWLDFSGRAVGSKLVMYSLPHSGTMPAMYEKMHKGGNHSEAGSQQHGGMAMMGGMQHGGDNKPEAEAGEHQGMSMGGMHGGGKGMMGGMNMMGNLAQGAKFVIATFKVTEKASASPTLPQKLVVFQRLTAADTDNAGQPIPIAISEGPMAMRLNARPFAMDQVMDIEKVKLGSIKKIKIFHAHGNTEKMEHDEKAAGDSKGMADKPSGMGGMQHGGNKKAEETVQVEQGGGMMGGMMMSMAHPIHLHGQQYQILSRKVTAMGSPGYETVKDGFIDSGWKDTVLVMPGEEVEIVKPFQDFKGLFLYHCHNLEHEGMDMMRQFYIS